MEPNERLRLLEAAAAELLQSETNGSLVIGVTADVCDPVVISALGSSVVVAVGHRGCVLIDVSRLVRTGGGPRVLAEGCDRTLRSVHGLPPDYVPTLAFGDPLNTRRFRASAG